mmetsp:Transcript_22867/g.48285  ORF Transcript_22867/g.48285 Transcript_22867/m.48285 type:complete len:88 (-) Transcript_22867:907-1170(-)
MIPTRIRLQDKVLSATRTFQLEIQKLRFIGIQGNGMVPPQCYKPLYDAILVKYMSAFWIGCPGYPFGFFEIRKTDSTRQRYVSHFKR